MLVETKILTKLEEFFAQFKHQVYKKGEILVRADDNPPGVFYLRQGCVKEYAISKKGDELVVNIFKPIAFFPMSWAINLTPNQYFFEAVTDVDVWRSPREKVIEFIKNNPDVLYDLMSRVYSGTDGILTRMTYLMAGNAYARVITELIIAAKRFGKKDNKQVTIEVSEKDLAAQSGMTRETVSREIKILKDRGLVSFSKHLLVIKDLQRLEEELLEGI